MPAAVAEGGASPAFCISVLVHMGLGSPLPPVVRGEGEELRTTTEEPSTVVTPTPRRLKGRLPWGAAGFLG